MMMIRSVVLSMKSSVVSAPNLEIGGKRMGSKKQIAKIGAHYDKSGDGPGKSNAKHVAYVVSRNSRSRLVCRSADRPRRGGDNIAH